MRILITLILTGALSLQIFPQITFEKTFGSFDDDEGEAVAVCHDGTYILAGIMENIYTGDPDVCLMRIDQYGDTIWTRTYVNEYHSDFSYDIIQSLDLGFVITGYTYSGDTALPFLLKYAEDGHFEWFKTYGNEIPDGYAYALVEKSDSGFVICGRQDFYNTDWYYRPFLLETKKNGEYVWSRIYDSFGDYAHYEVFKMCLSAESDYTLCGVYDDPLTQPNDQAWLLEVDTSANLVWQNRYGNADSASNAVDVKLTNDGGFIMCGSIRPGGIPWPGLDYDFYLLKTDNFGNEQWRRSIGYDDRVERGACLDLTDDGGFIIGGHTDYGAGHNDIWLVKTDENGDTLWTQYHGGLYNDGISDICVTPDGGYLLCGCTQSYGMGGLDIYLIKTNSNGLVTGLDEMSDALSNVLVRPNPGNGIFYINDCPDDISFLVYNIDGKVIMDGIKNGTGDKIDISFLSSGIYVLHLRSETSTRSIKLIKN
jgi:hypothetical protein